MRIYCDGIFDLFHYAHARLLEQAKHSFFPNVHLLVGVCSDATTHLHKGPTVLTESERYESVRHCRHADTVIPDAPWVITQSFLDEHRIDFVAHDGDPYPSADSADVYSFVKRQGRFLATTRTDGVSTSDLIARIIRDYDGYIRRNLRRGYSAEDLNVGFIKRQQVKLEERIENVKEKWERERSRIKRGFEEVEGEIDKHVQHAVRMVLGDKRRRGEEDDAAESREK